MPRHRFDCPYCEADILVDSNVKSGLLDDGCPICLAPVTTEAFSRAMNAE